MSVAGYIGKNGRELRMPRERRDELGIHYEGPVLSGEKSVEERGKEDATTVIKRGRESYESVEDYDPLLRAHCRL